LITLITLTQGNPIALKRTIDSVVSSFNGMVNEVIIGSLCVFQHDSNKLSDIVSELSIPTTTVSLPFNKLFKDGFGSTLNHLSEHATNDLCLYMNVGEIVECNINTSIISDSFNCYKFNHATETHQWIRMWNRKQLSWSGRIHEEVVGKKYVSPDFIFQMADTHKDETDSFYSQVMNTIKEYVYWNQYLIIANNPNELGATNMGWVKYAKDSYQSIEERMNLYPERLQAFRDGDLEKFLNHCKEVGFGEHKNDNLVHYQ